MLYVRCVFVCAIVSICITVAIYAAEWCVYMGNRGIHTMLYTNNNAHMEFWMWCQVRMIKSHMGWLVWSDNVVKLNVIFIQLETRHAHARNASRSDFFVLRHFFFGLLSFFPHSILNEYFKEHKNREFNLNTHALYRWPEIPYKRLSKNKNHYEKKNVKDGQPS